jgi:hypothetical protein
MYATDVARGRGKRTKIKGEKYLESIRALIVTSY